MKKFVIILIMLGICFTAHARWAGWRSPENYVDYVGKTADPPDKEGRMYYDTTANDFKFYNGTAWTYFLSGSAVWAVSIWDADADTGVQVEESSDEDTVRVDCAGVEIMVSTSATTTFIGDVTISGDLSVTQTASITLGESVLGDLTMGSATADCGDFTMQDGAQTGDDTVIFAMSGDGAGDFSITTDDGSVTIAANDDIFLLPTGGNVGIGESSPSSFIEMTNTSPEIIFHNTTTSDASAARSTILRFKGHQSGDEETTLATITASHYGVVDDQKGQIIFAFNDGDDDDVPSKTPISINSGGSTFANTTAFNGSTYMSAGQYFSYNSNSYPLLIASTTDTDTLRFCLGSTENSLLLIGADTLSDYDHTAQTNPTLFIHSVLDPDNSNSEYFSMAHDAADATFSCGLGGYSFEIAAQPARGKITVTGDPVLDETFTVNTTLFTAKDAQDNGSDEFLRTGTDTEVAAAIAAVINSGSTSAEAHAWNVAGVVYVEWLTKGTAGNSIVFTEGLSNVAFDATTLGTEHAGVAASAPMFITESGNVGVGVTAWGTNAVNVLGITGDGTVPSSSPAGMIQIYGDDSSDGAANATLAIRTEQAVESGAMTPSHKLKIWINGAEYYISLDAV